MYIAFNTLHVLVYFVQGCVSFNFLFTFTWRMIPFHLAALVQVVTILKKKKKKKVQVEVVFNET